MWNNESVWTGLVLETLRRIQILCKGSRQRWKLNTPRWQSVFIKTFATSQPFEFADTKEPTHHLVTHTNTTHSPASNGDLSTRPQLACTYREYIPWEKACKMQNPLFFPLFRILFVPTNCGRIFNVSFKCFILLLISFCLEFQTEPASRWVERHDVPTPWNASLPVSNPKGVMSTFCPRFTLPKGWPCRPWRKEKLTFPATPTSWSVSLSPDLHPVPNSDPSRTRPKFSVTPHLPTLNGTNALVIISNTYTSRSQVGFTNFLTLCAVVTLRTPRWARLANYSNPVTGPFLSEVGGTGPTLPSSRSQTLPTFLTRSLKILDSLLTTLKRFMGTVKSRAPFPK